MASGIYTITSPSGRRYIGSAADMDRRWSQHQKDLRIGKHGNINLQRAAVKYGLEMLEFSILLICAPRDLLMYEQRALDGFKPEYNIAPVAGSSLGIKRSIEFRKRVSVGLRGRIVSDVTRAKIGAKHRGKKLSQKHNEIFQAARKPISHEEQQRRAALLQRPEVKEKCNLAKIGHIVSDETRRKISLTLKGRRHSPERIAAIMAGKMRVTVQDGS